MRCEKVQFLYIRSLGAKSPLASLFLILYSQAPRECVICTSTLGAVKVGTMLNKSPPL